MIPSTVPNSPMNGALLPSVPSTPRLRSSSRSHRALAPRHRLATASLPRSKWSRPAAATTRRRARCGRRPPGARRDVAAAQQRQQLARQRVEVAAGAQEDRAFHHHRDRQDGQPMSSHSTHSDPSRVKPRIRSVKCHSGTNASSRITRSGADATSHRSRTPTRLAARTGRAPARASACEPRILVAERRPLRASSSTGPARARQLAAGARELVARRAHRRDRLVLQGARAGVSGRRFDLPRPPGSGPVGTTSPASTRG